MNIKILVITGDYNFAFGGEAIKGLSEVLLTYNIGFNEAVILPQTERNNIYKAMSHMVSEGGCVIICGGMTENNCITQSIAAEVLKKELVESKDAVDLMRLVYEFNKKELNQPNGKACYFPENSFIIPNQNSGISGFYLTEPVFFAAMPLEPKNAVNMFKSHVLGKMLGKLGVNYFIKLRRYRLFGLKEKELERLFEMLKKNSECNFNFEYSFGEIILSTYINGVSTQKLNENIRAADAAVVDIFKNHLYGYDDDELNTVCSNLLREKGVTIALAESLTGGYISNKLTDLPGSSGYFIYGGVVYSNYSKTGILGIDSGIIEKDGAVSESCAMEMANQVRKKALSDIGLAVTGFAGPKTPHDNYPVGTVFIALSSAKIKEVRKYLFTGSRSDIKAYTSKMALFWIYRLLNGTSLSLIKEQR
ncbi:MAG: nicotinamide-nucleotide amidohydrolase family protein [Deltaproteobacteria bacterium]|nr:nicotinamide-nucleotide amidohydrolase family protein [Deltaproteobacteria bacterium]